MASSAPRPVAVLLSGLVLLLGAEALAQGTGAAAGSSGFGGGGGGGGGGGSSSSSSGSSSESSGGSSSESSSRPPSAATFVAPAAELGRSYLAARTAEIPEAESAVATPAGARFVSGCSCLVIFALVFAGLGTLGWKVTKPAGARRDLELRRLSVGFDWTARAELQATLQTIASMDMGSDDRRRRALSEVVRVLVEKTAAARYAAQQSLRKSWSDAEPAFLAMTSQLRSRYRAETKGQHALDPVPELRARADEGQGLVVVSVVFCAVGRLPALPGRLDRESLRQALEGSLSPSAPRIVAFEMIWSPAEENDRMSSAELESLYPELLRVDAGSDVGRVQCGYCAGVFPAELGRCPACGAPRPAASVPASPSPSPGV